MPDVKDKFQYIFAIMIGAFALHCSQSAMHGGNGGGISDAHADTGGCCTLTPQTFKVISEGDIAISGGSSFQTPTIDTSQYRELVVSMATTGANLCYVQSYGIVWQEPGSQVFISTGANSGRVRVDGPTARISGYAVTNTTCSGSAHYLIAGVSLN